LPSANTNPYNGSIDVEPPTSNPIDLSLAGAIRRGLSYNLGAFLAGSSITGAQAQRLRALSQILPQISANIRETRQRESLRALGITFSQVPPTVELSVTDFRVNLSESLTVSALEGRRAAEASLEASRFDAHNARELVVVITGSAYLLAIDAEARLEAAQAQSKTAAALLQLADDQERAGLVAHIDALRAAVQLHAAETTAADADGAAQKQRMLLARIIGLSALQPLRLTDRVDYTVAPDVSSADAIAIALRERPDYQSALASIHAAELQERAARAERIPGLAVNADYGYIGPSGRDYEATWTATAILNVPVFDGGRIRADVLQAKEQLRDKRAMAENLRGAIEEDVATALLDITTARKKVEAARLGVDLANETLEQARDRFKAGLTNNIEIVQAQQTLAAANEELIDSLYAHNVAKVMLARATGDAEGAVLRFLTSRPPPEEPVATPAPQTDSGAAKPPRE
jgi:outer membrane protein TolC